MKKMDAMATRSLAGTTLILDFGAVISYTIFERHAETERRLGLRSGALQWWGPLDPDRDELWRDMLANKLTERDYWAHLSRAVGEMVGKDWLPVDFLKAARSPDLNDEIRPETTRLVRMAKAGGATLGILSNELELFYGAEALSEIELLREFDAIVDATHTKILKPDRRAYQLILDELGVTADRAVFVDDQPRNVKGGNEVGLTSIFFDVRDPEGSCHRALTALRERAAALADLEN